MYQRLILSAIALLCTATLSAQAFQEGVASYFDDSFDGKLTRYGVKYDKRELTCAHNLYPLGSLLRVTRLDNKRTVTVRVIDEGPFVKGRIIEVSRRAAEMLGMIAEGEAMVRVDLVQRGKGDSETAQRPTEMEQGESTLPRVSAPVQEAPATTTTTTRPAATQTAAETPPAPQAAYKAPETTTEKGPSAPATAPLVGKDFSKFGLYQVQLRKPAAQGWGVQVISISNTDFIFSEIASLQAKGFDNILMGVEQSAAGQTLYKLILGQFDTEAKARSYQKSLKSRYKMDGFVVNLARVGN
jgi:rare lipoprotein A